MKSYNRLYVLVREDLAPSYAAVQAGHGAAQYMVEYPGVWQNQTLIYLRVRDEKQLLAWRDKLIIKGIPYALFREPDIGNEATSLAAASDGKLFKDLPLL